MTIMPCTLGPLQPEALADVPITHSTAGQHVPTLARARNDTWGVFCLACSERIGDYIYPCSEGMWPSDQKPPAFVVEAEHPVRLWSTGAYSPESPDLAYLYDQES